MKNIRISFPFILFIVLIVITVRAFKDPEFQEGVKNVFKSDSVSEHIDCAEKVLEFELIIKSLDSTLNEHTIVIQELEMRVVSLNGAVEPEYDYGY